jgi:hypothetical protein
MVRDGLAAAPLSSYGSHALERMLDVGLNDWLIHQQQLIHAAIACTASAIMLPGQLKVCI